MNIMAQNETRGFSGMLRSIDCLHWSWKNCLFAWQGIYKERKEYCNAVLKPQSIMITGFGTHFLA
jgi:hypothetical protein